MDGNDEDICVEYPEVCEGATSWALSDDRPKEETIMVTAHGLRRLLRIARMAQGLAFFSIYKPESGIRNPFAEFGTPENISELMNKTTAVWCEGDLVMSRLFVAQDGQAVRHPNPEIDCESVEPWNRETHPSRGH